MLKSEAAAYLAGVTQTEGAEASAPTNLHVITGEVGEMSEDGKALVKIDGLMFSESDDQYIEIDALGGLEEGDIATLILTGEQGHAMTPLALGSIGSIDRITVRISEIEADYIKVEQLDAAEARIGELEADHVSVDDLDAATARIGTLETTRATITDLEAATARIHNLEVDHVTVNSFEAATARIGTLESDHVSTDDLDAATARIGTLETNTADIGTIRANSAKVQNLTAAQLEADHATVGSLSTNYAHITNGVIDNATIGYADVNNLSAHYAEIQNGKIDSALINTAAIVDEQVFTVTGNKATLAQIDASKINVLNLKAQNIEVERINGQPVTNKTLVDALTQHESDISDLDSKIDDEVEALNERIDGAIETFTGTAVPTLNNTPASQWNTDTLKDQHIGDVYYVVNDQSAQNGYCYRFTKSGSVYSWQLIKDSDVTAALSRLQTAEGKIGNIEIFDETVGSFMTNTNDEISSLKTKDTQLETSLGDKVSTSTFNTVSQKVDTNEANITSMSTVLTNNGLTSSTNITNTVNTVRQTAETNTSNISSLQTTVSGHTTTIGQHTTAIEQNTTDISLRATKTEVQQVRPAYATSTTGAGTAAKVATIDPAVTGYALYKGATVSVTFSTANTAATPTLNVNSTGAKQIRSYTGAALSEAEYKWAAGSTIDLVYDGAYWRMQDSGSVKRVTAAEASIRVNADNIESKVSKDGVISSINQSAETVKIQASKVEIDGTAIFSAISSDVDSAITSKGYATTAQAQGYATTAENNAKTYTDGMPSYKVISTTYNYSLSQWLEYAAEGAQDSWSQVKPVKVGDTVLIKGTASDTGEAVYILVTVDTVGSSNQITKATSHGLIDPTAGQRVQQNLDNLEIGGRNLLLWTGEGETYSAHTNVDRRWTLSTIYGTYVVEGNTVTFTKNGSGLTNNTSGIRISSMLASGASATTADETSLSFGLTLVEGDTYTFSCDVKTSGNRVAMHAQYFNGTSRWQNCGAITEYGAPVDTDWHRYSHTFTVNSAYVSLTALGIYCELTEGITISARNFKLERGNKATDWTPAPEDMATAADSVEYIAGTQTAATGSWTGVTRDSSLYTGKTIAYKLPYAGSGSASLQLKDSSGNNVGGNIAVYSMTTRVTTHYPAGSVIQMTYDGTYWRTAGWYNSNNYDRNLHNNYIKAAANVVSGQLVCGTSAGYKPIAASATFDMSYPILWAGGAWTSGTQYANAYETYPGVNPATTATVQGIAVNKMVYVKGQISGNTFTCAASNFLTCTVPSSEDGYFYLPVGIVANDATTKMYFNTSNDLYAYLDGKFRQVTPTEIVASQKIYYRSKVSGTVPKPTAWVTLATNKYNDTVSVGNSGWSTKVTPIASSKAENVTKYLYLYTCEQRKRLDGTVECTAVTLDENTTIIDGGNIITHTVTADQLNAASINASNSLTVGAMTTAAASTILNSNVQVGGRNLLLATGASQSKTMPAVAAGSYTTWDPYTMIGAYNTLGLTTSDSITVSFDWNVTGAAAGATVKMGTNASPWEYFGVLITFAAGESSGHVEKTFTVSSGLASATGTTLRARIDAVGNAITTSMVFTISNVKLEKGNKATDWTPAPEDQTAYVNETAYRFSQPNLSPFFSMAESDVYNASTNPSGYWKTFSSNYITILDDGWAHVSASNTGSSYVFCNYFTAKDAVPESFKTSTKYTFLVETRNVTRSGSIAILATHHFTNELHAFTATASFNVTGAESRYLSVTSASDISSIACFTRGYVQVAAGASIEMDLRISIYEGEYSGPYKPYSGDQLYATNTALAGTNESLIGAITDIGELTDQFTETVSGQNQTFADIQKSIETLSKALDAEIQSRQQWLKFDAVEGLIIGAQNSTFQTVTTNTSQQFKSGGIVLAETSGDEFLAPRMRSDQLLIGNWMWARRDNGNLSLKWIG